MDTSLKRWLGQRVHVFQKPYTREDYEGVAVVASVDFSRQDDDLFPCRVRFVEDGPDGALCGRLVSEQDILPAPEFRAPWGD